MNVNDLEEDVKPVEVDATPERSSQNWKGSLIDIDGGLDDSDISCIKFLLRGYISDSKLQKAVRGIDLFQNLDNAGVIDISNGQLELVEECLYRIHRKDLLRKFPSCDPVTVKERLDRNREEIRNNVDTEGKLRKELLPFRILLFEIGEDIDETEFKSALFSLSTLVPRGQLSKMKTIFDLFLYLEKKDELSPGNVDILPKVLINIDRRDMLDKVEQYKNNRAGINNSIQNTNRRSGEGRSGALGGRRSGIEQMDMEEGRHEPAEMPRQNYISRRPAVSDGQLTHIASELKDCNYVREMAKDLGLTETQINTQMQQSKNNSAMVYLSTLRFWQTHVMENSEECRPMLIRVLRKYGQRKALAVLGIIEEEPPAEPAPQPTRPQLDSVPNLLPEEPVLHPEPGPLPPVFQHRLVAEMETQTSMISVGNGVYRGQIGHDDRPNFSVSNTEARISQPTEPIEPTAPPNNLVQSGRVLDDQQAGDILAGQMRFANTDDERDMPSYKMNSRPRGIAVIINNKTFFKVPNDANSKEMPPRMGTDKDAEKLMYIFQKLGFITSCYNDLEDFAMHRQMVEQSFKDHTNYDCFVCCILSHGVLGHVYGTNGRLVRIQELTSSFRAQKCPSLAGKPKLFFIQACQGREKQEGHDIESDAAGHRDLEADHGGREMIPDEADFVLGYATVPGYVSYRSRTQGSWFVNKLVQMLDKYSDRYDLLSILVKVNEEVGRANANLEGGMYKQIPAPLVTLRKKLFFR